MEGEEFYILVCKEIKNAEYVRDECWDQKKFLGKYRGRCDLEFNFFLKVCLCKNSTKLFGGRKFFTWFFGESEKKSVT
jgi:hypothetical protein